jgi:hypothetical protein
MSHRRKEEHGKKLRRRCGETWLLYDPYKVETSKEEEIKL